MDDKAVKDFIMDDKAVKDFIMDESHDIGHEVLNKLQKFAETYYECRGLPGKYGVVVMFFNKEKYKGPELISDIIPDSLLMVLNDAISLVVNLVGKGMYGEPLQTKRANQKGKEDKEND